jgi:hypothetical protein
VIVEMNSYTGQPYRATISSRSLILNLDTGNSYHRTNGGGTEQFYRDRGSSRSEEEREIKKRTWFSFSFQDG